VSWPEKGSGAFAFFLIFFPLFVSRQKGVKEIKTIIQRSHKKVEKNLILK